MRHIPLHSRYTSAVLLPALLAAFTSCTVSPSESPRTSGDNQDNVIASIDLLSEGKIDFIEEEPGCLVTIGTFSSVDFFTPYKDLNPVELYNAFKGQAPEKLKTAYHNAVLASGETSVQDRIPDLPPNPQPESSGIAKKELSGTYFQAHYCVDHSYDFDACYPDHNENLTYINNCSYMKAFVNAVTDTMPVTFNVYYYNSGWINTRSYNITKGILLTYAVAGSRKYRMFEMLRTVAFGDRFNISIMGNYELD